MKVDNNNYAGGKTVKEMEEQLKRCLDFEEKYGKSIRTTSWIKWCTSEKYRKRSQDFNQSIARTMRSMNPVKLYNIINNK